MTGIDDLPLLDDEFELFDLDDLINDKSLSLSLKTLITQICNKSYQNDVENFKNDVQLLTSKDDKSEAGKLVAASANTTDAFKSVKSAMGDQGFTAVVKYLSVHNHSQARSLVKSMTRKKDNFDSIRDILGDDYFHQLSIDDVRSIFKSVDSRSYKTFSAVASAFKTDQYETAFEDESLKKKHSKSIETMENESKKRRNTSPSLDSKRRRLEPESGQHTAPAVTGNTNDDDDVSINSTEFLINERILEPTIQQGSALAGLSGVNIYANVQITVNNYNQPPMPEPRPTAPEVEEDVGQGREGKRTAIAPNNFLNSGDNRHGSRGFERR